MKRVAIVEDHTIARQGLNPLLRWQPDIGICGEAGTGIDGIGLVRDQRPDVVLLDLSLPDIPRVDAIHEIVSACPETWIIVLSMHSEPEYVKSALRAGAAGYLVKGADIGDLLKAIRSAVSGEVFLSAGVAKTVLEESGPNLLAKLTDREMKVLRWVARGKTSREVASTLGISAKTVDNHRQNIMSKAGLHDAVSLTRFAIRTGLVSPD